MADLAQRIAQWAVNYRLDAHRAATLRMLVRDFAACVVQGSQRAELSAALRLARPGAISVWGGEQKFDAPSAALVCGTAGSLLQLHDIYTPALLHPSCTVIAAAMAVHADSVTPTQFLNAVAVGYELVNRLGDACRTNSAGFAVTTATAGALGASVAATLLRDGDERSIARALSLTPLLMPVTPVAAVRTHAEATALHGGLAARAAVEASLLANELETVTRVFEGDVTTPGYWQALTGREITLDPEQWQGSTLGEVIGKRWPGCFGAYAALEAILNMCLPSVEKITEVHIGLPRRLLPMVELGPSSGLLYDRLMSVRWLVARALVYGQLNCDDLDNDAATDRWVACIELHHDASLDSLPIGMLASNVEIYAYAGQRHRQSWRRELQDDSAPLRGTLMQNEPKAWRAKYRALTANAAGMDTALAKLLGQNLSAEDDA